jgi:hypothetical protein
VATTLDLPNAIRIDGQAAKRGLLPRMPAGERLLADIAAWLVDEYPDQIRVVGRRSVDEDVAEPRAELRLALHPAAPDLTLRASDTGAVTAAAETAAAGPGYHRFVGRIIERLGIELAIDWAADADDFAFADRPTVERAYLGWLGPVLAQARSARRRGQQGIHLGIPAGTRFTVAGAIATALGPRDDDWLDAAIGDPRVAIEITPWWSDATDGQYLLNRALTLLWLDVRWRRPAVAGESDTLHEVHRLLSRAVPLEPDLPYPWHAWAEVVAFLDVEDGMTRQILERISDRPAPQAPIGYRRDPVTITHEGWSLEIPGDFAERRTDEEWWGGGAGRGVTLAAVETGAMPPVAFLAQVASDLGPEALTHRAGEVHGKARITSDASSGLEVGVLDGFSAVTGSGAAIRITFDDPADWQWALDLWRSLAPG